MKLIVVYIRVSTKKQEVSGLGLEAQQASVARFLATGDFSQVAEFVEVESGKNCGRPKLAEAMKLCRETGATLVVAKLDRLARNVAFTSALMESGVEFIACDMPTANRLTIHIMAAMAEDEAARISQRTKDALAAKKARGVKLGSARPGHWDGREHLRGWSGVSAERKRDLKAAKLQASFGAALPMIRSLTERGESSGKIAATLNQHAYLTPRGRRFTADTVNKVLARLQAIA